MNIKSYDEMIQERRLMLKSEEGVERDEWTPHQIKGIPPPPLEKPYPKDSVLVELASRNCPELGKMPLVKTIVQRRSRRKYSSKALKLEELSFLLYATQRVTQADEDRVRSKRVVPSGGARHPFETYLIVNRVENLEPGVYRYLAIEHKLLMVDRGELLSDTISRACLRQSFIGESAVVFVWAAIPYRTEWRYSVLASKDILIEAGHICQNLYLACEAIGAGTCAIAAYDQKAMDSLIGVDGVDEFTVYLAPVGKIEPISARAVVENVEIMPISKEYIESFHNCLDSIARERRYLGPVKAPSLESTREAVLSNILKNIPQYVAVEDDIVVGWCEILPNEVEGFTHSGKLESMGVSRAYRGKGIGRKLMESTILAAKEFGIERVELLVYKSNIPAIRFYEKAGFVHEGLKKKARKLDGKYDDVLLMALFISTT